MSELFPRTSSLRHGYDRGQVEEFFSRARQAYERAAADYRAWLGDGTLSRSARPAMYAYRQTFQGADGASVQRRGLTCCIDCRPFGPRPGGGVLPHEETFSGPKEDRFALFRIRR